MVFVDEVVAADDLINRWKEGHEEQGNRGGATGDSENRKT